MSKILHATRGVYWRFGGSNAKRRVQTEIHTLAHGRINTYIVYLYAVSPEERAQGHAQTAPSRSSCSMHTTTRHSNCRHGSARCDNRPRPYSRSRSAGCHGRPSRHGRR